MGIRVILASASPRRKELLKLGLEEFDILPADIDETLPEFLEITQGPVYLASQKARALALEHPDALIIGCDTGVFIDDKMLGKPADRQEGEEMLRMLSGRRHQVITGCCLCYQGVEYGFQEEALVEMYPLSSAEIQSYLNTGEYSDKAGSYGIQGKGALLIKGIEGDYYNVMGRPIARLMREIGFFLTHLEEM